jgi:hypothetical protein
MPSCGSGGKTKRMEKRLREELIGPYLRNRETDNLTQFEDLPLETLGQLIKAGFVDLDDWNNAPTASAFASFMERNPGFTAHGYVISWKRNDARITIEGVEKYAKLTQDEVIDFASTFRFADDFELATHHAY